ncbi:hypothetical protein EJB05_06702, partial [Eragrostis curvula]
MARRGAISSAARRPAGRCPLRRRSSGLRRGARIGRARAAEGGAARGLAGWGFARGKEEEAEEEGITRDGGHTKAAAVRGGWRGSLDSTFLLICSTWNTAQLVAPQGKARRHRTP